MVGFGHATVPLGMCSLNLTHCRQLQASDFTVTVLHVCCLQSLLVCLQGPATQDGMHVTKVESVQALP